MNAQSRFAVAIVADDQTAKGVLSAEKRLGGIGKKAKNRFGKDLQDISSGSAIGSVGRIVKSFGAVERASSRAFGARSATAGIADRLGAIRQAAGSTATGLAAAAAEGSTLGTALGVVGVAAGATVGVLVAAGAATYKLVSNWSDAGASLGRLSQMLGVATKDLQEFQGAGQRYGIDKDAMNGAIGGIARTFHDARYGRNNEAAAIMSRLGVRFKYGADGNLDYKAMTLDLSDALARQRDPQTRALIAERFGGTAALPLLMQGSTKVRAEMSDIDKTGVMLSDRQVQSATAVQRQGVMARQMVERQITNAGGFLGENVAAPVMSRVVQAGRDMTGAADKMDGAATTMQRAANQMAGPAGASDVPAGRSRFSARTIPPGLNASVITLAQQGERKYGIPASLTLAQYGLESSWGRRMPRGSNNPFGIKARRGEPFVRASTKEVDRQGRVSTQYANFRRFSSLGEAFDAHGALLSRSKVYAGARAHAADPEAFADALTRVYATDPNYGSALQRMLRQNNLQRFDHGKNAPPPPEQRIVLEVHGLPHGTRVTAKGSAMAAVGYAIPNFGNGM